MLLDLLLLGTGGGGHHGGGHHGRGSCASGAVHVAVARRHHTLAHVALGAYEYYVQLQGHKRRVESEKQCVFPIRLISRSRH